YCLPVAAGKLVATNGVGLPSQGSSVALSADGKTAAVGGLEDNNRAGATWVYTRSGAAWAQQAKLVGTGAVGGATEGTVALSADGDTLIAGGCLDNNSEGATWVFIRDGSTWIQQGPKLVGTGNVGAAFQGTTALSADGNTALIGGSSDNNNQGAAWV